MLEADALEQQVFLVFEHLIERALRNLQACGDVVHLHVADAVGQKFVERILHDALAQFFLMSLTLLCHLFFCLFLRRVLQAMGHTSCVRAHKNDAKVRRKLLITK